MTPSPITHDITLIERGEARGRAFKKGHVIKGEDNETLLDLGKKHIYVWDLLERFIDVIKQI